MGDHISLQVQSQDKTSSNLRLDMPLTKLSQVSTARVKAFDGLGVKDIRGLINYFPKSYIDLSTLSTVAEAKIGFNYTICATLHSIEEKEPKPGLKLIEFIFTDETGTLICTAFQQPWLKDSLKVGDDCAVAGKVEFNYGFKRITNPFINALEKDEDLSEFAKIVPIYKSNDKISSSWIRRIVKNALEFVGPLESFVPDSYREKYKLMEYWQALCSLHSPSSQAELKLAQRTLKYTQVFLQQLALLKDSQPKSLNKTSRQVLSCEFCKDKIDKSIDAIGLYKDLGGQSLMLFASEILLKQYKQYIEDKLLKVNVKSCFIDGDTIKADLDKFVNNYNSQKLDVLIGTKALIDAKINSSKISLLVVDEKTDFKKFEIAKFLDFSSEADNLFLTTKALTRPLATLLYPDCVFRIFGYKNRKVCHTKVWQKDEALSAYEESAKFVDDKKQAIIVSPLIGINSAQRDIMSGKSTPDNNHEKTDYDIVSLEDSNSLKIDNNRQANTNFEIVKNKYFQDKSCALITKNINNNDILKTLEDFKNGKIDVLFLTERVNFDIVPHAEVCMIIEDSDRIGLSYLHGLRNFTLNGKDNSYLHLICASKQAIAKKRLNLVINVLDGQSLVEQDLLLRNIGNTLGFENWGFSYLNLISYMRDSIIVQFANKDAIELIEDDPKLKKRENKFLSYEISRAFGEL